MNSLYAFFLALWSFIVSSSVSAGAVDANVSYKYQLAIAAIFRNDAPYLREWIEFHKLVGVDHFWLYNHNSNDDYREVLEPYIREGVVELIEWSSPADDWNGFCFGVQPAAYRDAIKRAAKRKSRTKWLAIIDSDEFLFPVKEMNLVETLENYYKDCSGVCVNWQVYGTSGVAAVPPDMLMIEVLLYKAPQEAPRNRYYKSIVRPMRVRWCGNPHFCEYQPGYWHVNAKGERFTMDNKGVYVDRIRINHYWTRDEHYMYTFKVPRYQHWNNANGVIEALAELNLVYDPSITKYLPALRARIFH